MKIPPNFPETGTEKSPSNRRKFYKISDVKFGKSTSTIVGSSAPAASDRLHSHRLDRDFVPDQAPNGCESSFQSDLPNPKISASDTEN